MSEALSPTTALVTGASSGIGAVYARRLAARGHDLVLVARRADRLQALAEDLVATYGNAVRILAADLTRDTDIARVEDILRSQPIALLVNNAGMGPIATSTDLSDVDAAATLALNVTALMRLSRAALPGMLARNQGGIINVGSVIGFHALPTTSLYSATKAFVLTYSQALAQEVGGTEIRIQAVLPAGTMTDFYETAGMPMSAFDPNLFMTADDLVDAGLAGFDRGETVTLPALHDEQLWTGFETARVALFGGNGNARPAPRYL